MSIDSVEIAGLEKEKPVAVVGLGISGLASVQALHEYGYQVLAIDSSPESLEKVEKLQLPGVKSECVPAGINQAEMVDKYNIKTVIVSPALPATGEFFAYGNHKGWQMLGEIELAWRVRSEKAKQALWLGITGTNGKTTTTSLLANIFTEAGYYAPALGNIGAPVVLQAMDNETGPDIFVCELSSFQLHSVTSVSLDASVLLNLADDHLDWHGSFQEYMLAKANIFHNNRLACVYPVSNSSIRTLVEEAEVQEGCRAVGTTLGVPGLGEIGLVEDLIVDRAFYSKRYNAGNPILSLSELKHISGTDKIPSHLLEDIIAACSISLAGGLDSEQIRKGISTFSLGAHRISLVSTTAEGVRWIDDSKATNAHAALASISAQEDGKCVWIAGGIAKGAQFHDLVAKVASKIAGVVVIGKDKTPILEALEQHAPHAPIYLVPTEGDGKEVMRCAVRASKKMVPASGSVLLAPACASMDEFISYAHRGELFAQAVKDLEEA